MVMQEGLKNNRKIKYKGKYKWILSVESNGNNILHSVKYIYTYIHTFYTYVYVYIYIYVCIYIYINIYIGTDLKCYQNRNK